MLALAVVAVDGGPAFGAMPGVHVVVDAVPFSAVVEDLDMHYWPPSTMKCTTADLRASENLGGLALVRSAMYQEVSM